MHSRKNASIISILFFIIYLGSCSQKTADEPQDKNTLDSIFENTDEKIRDAGEDLRDVNEGVQEGFEKTEDDLQKGIDKLKLDSLLKTDSV